MSSSDEEIIKFKTFHKAKGFNQDLMDIDIDVDVDDEIDLEDLESDDESFVEEERNREEEEEEDVGGGLGLGASRGGLGASTHSNPAKVEGPQMQGFANQPTEFSSTKSEFISKSKQQRLKQPSHKVDKDFAKFEQYSKGIGSKVMKKMGYVFGMGLGKDGSGISKPIEVKLRPHGAGLGMIAEKVASKTPEEEDAEKGIPAAGFQFQRHNRWKKQGIKKRKPLYKSAVELIQETEIQEIPPPTKILDMTGSEMRILEDFSSVSQVPDTSERLPELRHNVRLIADLRKNELLHLARQVRLEKTHQESRRAELVDICQMIKVEESRMARLEHVQKLLHECQNLYQQNLTTLSNADPNLIAEVFGTLFGQLSLYIDEFGQYHIDGLILAIITPVFKNMMVQWNPLSEPLYGLDSVKQWHSYIKNVKTENNIMTAFDYMIYTYWLPKLRSTINNDWNVTDPDCLISLLDEWNKAGLLPSWLASNISQTLILPKLKNTIENWDIKSQGWALHLWVYPWLPLLQDAMLVLYEHIRRKFSVYLIRYWIPTDPLAQILVNTWKPVLYNLHEVLPESEMNILLRQTILGILVNYMKTEFRVNPRDQDINPLTTILEWNGLIPSHLISTLLEKEFFPKWSQALWSWLTSPSVNLQEVTAWYSVWKSYFGEKGLMRLESVKEGLRMGLDMMNQVSAGSKTFVPTQRVKSQSKAKTEKAKRQDVEITFKEYIEMMCSNADIEFVPSGRIHQNGKEMYKLGMLNVYVDDGLLFVQEGGSYKFMSIEDAVELASK